MILQLRALFLCHVFLFVVDAKKDHYEDPVEVDVTSPTFCHTNDDGYGGLSLSGVDSDEITIKYNYKLDVRAGHQSYEDVILPSLEKAIANLLLSTHSFHLCDSRRVLEPSNGKALGLTTNPPDLPLYLPCDTGDDSTVCEYVDGEFFVYVETNSANDAELKEAITNQLKTALMPPTETDLIESHSDIVNITWIDSFDPVLVDESNEPGQKDRTAELEGDSTAVIIGASVGGVLVLGLLAFYRKRHSKARDGDSIASREIDSRQVV